MIINDALQEALQWKIRVKLMFNETELRVTEKTVQDPVKYQRSPGDTSKFSDMDCSPDLFWVYRHRRTLAQQSPECKLVRFMLSLRPFRLYVV